MQDSYGRDINYLRISITDRCNLRCVYCMPEEGVAPISHTEILSYEEILRLVGIFSTLGIKHIRLTGGEPLVRKGVENLISDIKKIPGIETVSITTNGILIPEKIEALLAAGLDAVNISLDTLNPKRFENITRREGFEKVIEAIKLCEGSGIKTKVNCVAMKGVNEDELASIAGLAEDLNIAVRFIEYMPVGKNDFEKCVRKEDILKSLTSVYGPLYKLDKNFGNGPADYYKPEGFVGAIGIISAMTCNFCENCNRIRLTAEGFLKLCLQYDKGITLRDMMRDGATDEELAQEIEKAVKDKPKQHIFNDYQEHEGIEEKNMSRIGG
ncbi:MAG: GTP 3',8-cyclase MoaA [Oscillospiraceae bacterium]|nr:GTP 3',8-cyclase MoaA [Candidatus Limimonas coprohippi]MCQ2488159.1 GTP 3',8-cyclase MoaA [Clostridia bacterium]